jgi:small nuclear ribonucleoprotein (snRNP)-like protein
MEKLSINKAKPIACTLDRYLGQRVVLRLGPVTYTGILSAVEQHWMVLTDATITGSRHVAQVVEVWVHHPALNRIAHIHLGADLLGLEVLA